MKNSDLLLRNSEKELVDYLQALEKRKVILRLREIDTQRIRSLQREVSVSLAY
ncbi:hypothetical protein ES704_01503 [subsurface metagenome]